VEPVEGAALVKGAELMQNTELRQWEGLEVCSAPGHDGED